MFQHHGVGDLFDEQVASLLRGRCQGCQNTPSGCPWQRFVAAGEFATDDGGAQLPLGEIVRSVAFGIVQKGQQVVLLLGQAVTNFFLLLSLGVAGGRG